MSVQNNLFQLDTALTDYLICIEAVLFLALLTRLQANSPRFKLMGQLLFATLAGASLLGGISHSFITDPATSSHRMLWHITMLMIGGIGWSAWNLGAALLNSRVQSAMMMLSTVAFLSYGYVVLFISQRYLIAIGHYLLGVVFLLGALEYTRRYAKQGGTTQALSGVTLSVFAPIPHIFNLSPLPNLLSPNAIYHLIQAVALMLIFVGLKQLVPNFTSRSLGPHKGGQENQAAR